MRRPPERSAPHPRTSRPPSRAADDTRLAATKAIILAGEAARAAHGGPPPIGSPDHEIWLLGEVELLLGLGGAPDVPVDRIVRSPGATPAVWRRLAAHSGHPTIRDPLAEHPVARTDPVVRAALEQSTALAIQRLLFTDDSAAQFVVRWRRLLARGETRECAAVLHVHARHPGLAALARDDYVALCERTPGWDASPGGLATALTVPAWAPLAHAAIPQAFEALVARDPAHARHWLAELAPELTGRVSSTALLALVTHPQSILRAEAMLDILEHDIRPRATRSRIPPPLAPRDALLAALKSTLEQAVVRAPVRIASWMRRGGSALVARLTDVLTPAEADSIVTRVASHAFTQLVRAEQSRAELERTSPAAIPQHRQGMPIPAATDPTWYLERLPKHLAPHVTAEALMPLLEGADAAGRLRTIMAASTAKPTPDPIAAPSGSTPRPRCAAPRGGRV
jgi:hypothetical protein